jgi:hypothetical protein
LTGSGFERAGSRDPRVGLGVVTLVLCFFGLKVEPWAERLAVVFPEVVVVLREAVEHTLGGGPAEVDERRVVGVPAHHVEGEEQLVAEAVDHVAGGDLQHADLDPGLIEERRDVLAGVVDEDSNNTSMGGFGGEELGDAGVPSISIRASASRSMRSVASRISAFQSGAARSLAVAYAARMSLGGAAGGLGGGVAASGHRSCSETSSARATFPRWRA